MTGTPDLTDAELLGLLRADGRDAFAALYQKYWAGLYNAAYKRTRNKEQCQDIVQNVFADLWNRRHSVQIDNVAAYLHTAVRFQLYKQINRKPGTAVFLDSFEEIITSPIAADDQLREKEVRKLIGLWLAALPERRRQIFILHYQEDLSTREIADRLGISQNTVQAQLHTATQSLRRRLAHYLSVAILVNFLVK